MNTALKKIQRKLCRFYNAKPIKLNTTNAVISFTFDDVPKTAVTIGAKILERYNLSGTFYLSGSLAEGQNLDLEQYHTKDIQKLLDAGHEIGCHTFGHISIQNKNSQQIEEDLNKNDNFLRPHIQDHDLSSFSYPFGCASITAKNIIKKRFATARGITPGINTSISDLSQLKANAIYDKSMTKERIDTLIKTTKEQNGWLVFYTHDLSETPTEFGCSPALFEYAVKQAKNNECEVLNMRSALARKCFKQNN